MNHVVFLFVHFAIGIYRLYPYNLKINIKSNLSMFLILFILDSEFIFTVTIRLLGN